MSLIDDFRSWFNFGGYQYLRTKPLLDGPEGLKALLGSTPKATIINVAASGVKTTHTFSDNLRSLMIRCEKVTEIKYNFNEADYDLDKKLTITSGGFLALSGLDFNSEKIFFETDRNNVDVEILEILA